MRHTELSKRTDSASSKKSDSLKKNLVEGMLCFPLLGGMLSHFSIIVTYVIAVMIPVESVIFYGRVINCRILS